MGLWNSHTSVGNIAGSLVAGAFVERDWALSFIIPGLIIILMSLPVLLFLVPRKFAIRSFSANSYCARWVLKKVSYFGGCSPIVIHWWVAQVNYD